jgi:site-specific DNA-methyltransferase (adenine-specific)
MNLSGYRVETDESGNKMILGNCLEVLPLLLTNSVDYVLTSPPYNRKRNDKYSNFKDINADWLMMNKTVITELLRITKNHIFYNIQTNFYNRADVYKLIGHFSENIVDIHIWEKSNPMPASGKSITNAVEYFLILGDTSLKSNQTYTKNIITTSVNSNMPSEHKAVMKTEVAEHFISRFTGEGEVILDCFSGYGTTGLVAKSLNRKYIGIEMIESYFDMSLDRLEFKNVKL